MNFKQWFRTIWSEPNGNGSSTRVHMTALIAFIIGVGVTFGVATHQKRISVSEFNNFLTSGATFITTTCGTLFGINKLNDWAKNRDNQNATTPPTTPGV